MDFRVGGVMQAHQGIMAINIYLNSPQINLHTLKVPSLFKAISPDAYLYDHTVSPALQQSF